MQKATFFSFVILNRHNLSFMANVNKVIWIGAQKAALSCKFIKKFNMTSLKSYRHFTAF